MYILLNVKWISHHRLQLEKTEKVWHKNMNFRRAGILFSFTAVSLGAKTMSST